MRTEPGWQAFVRRLGDKEGTGLALPEHERPEDGILDTRVMAFADGRRWLAVAQATAVYRVALDPDSGQPGAWAALPTSPKEGSFSALTVDSGGRVAGGTTSGVIRVWPGKEGGEANSSLLLTGHAGRIRSLLFTPDGTRLISGGADGTARIWNVTSVIPNQTVSDSVVLTGHTKGVTSLSLAPAAGARPARLITTGSDGTARVWTLDRDRLLERAESLLRDAERD
jgi:WD40 repeat protein